MITMTITGPNIHTFTYCSIHIKQHLGLSQQSRSTFSLKLEIKKTNKKDVSSQYVLLLRENLCNKKVNNIT